MPSVGIMSMQRIFNYGSSLQAFALKRLIEDLDDTVSLEFVDYRPGTPLVNNKSSATSSVGRLGRAAAKVREYSNVKASARDKLRFFNHKRTYAQNYYPLIGIKDTLTHDLNVDLQVIGSDEVFNCVQSNTNVGYSRDLFGHGSTASSVISYAGSFGNTTLKKIDDEGLREELASDFMRFDAVSVRDRNSSEIVEALTGQAPSIHLDPTLVFDFDRVGDRIPADRQINGKYVIVYGYSGRFSPEENSAVRRYASKIGARVLAFGGLQASADEFIDCDPFTLLAYFRDAAAVVTDTFHGTIFSAINEVPFATIIRSSKGAGYGNEEKLSYVLERLGLSDRALRSTSQLDRLLEEPVDYTQSREVRAFEATSTNEYLTAALARTQKDAS